MQIKLSLMPKERAGEGNNLIAIVILVLYDTSIILLALSPQF